MSIIKITIITNLNDKDIRGRVWKDRGAQTSFTNLPLVDVDFIALNSIWKLQNVMNILKSQWNLIINRFEPFATFAIVKWIYLPIQLSYSTIKVELKSYIGSVSSGKSVTILNENFLFRDCQIRYKL